MKPLTALVVVVLGFAFAGAVAFREWGPGRDDETVTIVHWSTGHLLQTGSGLRLLEQMAEEFNDEGHRTAEGKKVRVEVYYASGATQVPELASRVTRGVPGEKRDLPNPTLVTPSASHWLVNVNQKTGRNVFDLADTESRSIVRSYVGIVTFREVAECLGWPEKAIGFEDIIALRSDPQGWKGYKCAKGTTKVEWGERPLLVFTDPTTSDTGRAVLFMLYAIAAGKAPEDLTVEDLQRPDVVRYVSEFQNLVDHYQIDSSTVNSKVYQGPRFGQFFIMPEDNLIHLYEGTEEAFINGVEGRAPKLTRDVVMIYPKEGALLRENCACLVGASWVDDAQRDGAEQWFRYLREDKQQQSFMLSGFRPGTTLPVSDSIGPRYGLNPATPSKVLHTERVEPGVAAAMDASWDDVKRPGIVTFVVDTSNSMKDDKLPKAKQGLVRALDNMAQNNQAGLVTFDTKTVVRLAPGPLNETKLSIAEEARSLRAQGQTALYDAILVGIRLSDEARGDPNAIRAVVVLTDGKANQGVARLDSIVKMSSSAERPIARFPGMENDASGYDDTGRAVAKADISGDSISVPTTHRVQVFFIGIGDADLEIGRILSEASGAEFQGVSDEDLAKVLEAFSKYF